MRAFRFAFQVDVIIEIDEDSGHTMTPENILRLAWRKIAGSMKLGKPEDQHIPGVKMRMFSRSFAPKSPGVAEVVEITPEMATGRPLIPKWKLMRVSPEST